MYRMVSALDIRRAIQELDLSNHVLCIHASLRSFGQVDGGASTLIEALLAEGCTVLVPTFSYFFEIAPPSAEQPARNGMDYVSSVGVMPGTDRVFSAGSIDLSREYMGAVPAAVLAHPDHVRGNHPLNSFSAVGSMANQLIEDQTPENVYAPLAALIQTGGLVVMMGVGLERMTLLHLAEQHAGRNLFVRWANGPDGQPVAANVGSCSDGFGRFDPVLEPIMQTEQVGQSEWRIYPAAGVIELAAEAIQDHPQITHCGSPVCERCNDAVQGGPVLPRLKTT
jgi:aminoglycoside 3-N-acetyltransferase